MTTISIVPPNTVIAGLQQLLADTAGLTALTQQAHYNIIGPDFFQLHEIFGSQYESLFDDQDTLAERIRALQGFVKGNLADLASQAKTPILNAPFSAQDAVKTLLQAHEAAVESFLIVAALASESEDDTTENMLLTMVEAHQKTAWMLRSYLR